MKKQQPSAWHPHTSEEKWRFLRPCQEIGKMIKVTLDPEKMFLLLCAGDLDVMHSRWEAWPDCGG
jgi:hypothetical protein